jgi:hypothetical protein
MRHRTQSVLSDPAKQFGLALAVALALASPAGALSAPALDDVTLGAPAGAARHDDCDAGFIAFLGAEAYQFSPAHAGDLGAVRLFTVLSHTGAAARGDGGRAFWRLEIRGPEGAERTVRTAGGLARLDEAGRSVAEFTWDGRDEAGRQVAPGRYRYTFLARFLPDRARPAWAPRGYADLAGMPEAVEAFASTETVIVDYALDEATARQLRVSAAVGSCQAQQNTPVETGFGYNFYYGSTHSHSNYSDGGQPAGACSSGNAWGSGTFDPAAVFDYARFNGGVDYWVVNEHNHLLEDAIATNDPPVTEAKVRQRYAAGRAAAVAATVDDVFVALYGMEWGVTTNADQGHVTLLETPALFGWETCSNCNGPNPECTPGTNCYFDVFTPKRFGYLTMYKRSVENPSPAGALGILCHPGTGQFDNYAFNADADAALQGIAVRSGLAFNTATDCADANVASTDYSGRWKTALNLGFHLGPVAEHDAHCNTYGQGIPNRTVYLLPNGATPVLTRTALMQAHKARRFFTTEDTNAQLVFATGDGAHVMGEVFAATLPLTLRAAVYDPAGEAVSTLEVWRGQIGGGVPGAAYRSVTGQSTLTFTETAASGTYYYYVHAVQADGHDLWSAPMWITYQGGGCQTCGLDVSGYRLDQQSAADSFTLPAGTTIPDDGYLIVGRDAAQAAFEAFWRGGTPLPANAVYLDAAGAFPAINGDERYELFNATGQKIDGRTVAMPASAGKTLQRKDPCQPAAKSASWTTSDASAATPGSGAGPGCGEGVVINEFSDALGTGNFVYEFIELHWDK